MPSISIIVPVYKVEQYLSRCVESILAQTHSDFQLILVDDGSPDNCPDLCDEYAKKDQRIVVLHQKNQGLSAARNAGIDWVYANSDSQWIAFADSDDWLHPRFLEAMYQGALKHQTKIASCRWQRIEFKEDAIQSEDFTCKVLTPFEDYCSRNNDHDVDSYAWRFLYHRDLFRDIRYPLGRHWEDLFTTYRLLFQCEAVAHCEAVLYYYFIRSDSIARAPWRPHRLDMLDALEENLAFFQNSHWPELYQRLLLCYEQTIPKQLERLRISDLSAELQQQYAQLLQDRLSKMKEKFST